MKPQQSIADIQRRIWSRRVNPYLLTLPCLNRCEGGLMLFTGRSYQQGSGPLINIHTCSVCGEEEEIAEDYYPRLEYRDEDGRQVDLAKGISVWPEPKR
jgi:hypothetical protein